MTHKPAVLAPSLVLGLTRVDAHVVRGTFADMPTVTKLMQVLTSLEPIQEGFTT